ncbi:histone-lysine N-methyltransferase, H3 lysine-79 specific-like [Haliotis rubra]|uniref:histone-lysine N-methyltransferase, H3 lysine-79 specific-like n=1 Tax=Haliotis rubra TaxID=36100 RepID=UPI001EE5825D|nr:histone-lysine N-methyltransferase, H3 lysine-79 specific-like [Haliotis rubra]
MVNDMVVENGGECYTNEMYERCEADLREAVKNEKLDGKRQKQLEEKLKQETAAFEEQIQNQRIKMQEMEKQLEKERQSREKDREDQRKEQEKKHVEEEKKRQAVQKEAAENMKREYEKMKEFQKMQMEEFERRKEELKELEIRKQIREKIEEGKVGIIRTVFRTMKGFFVSLW